MLILLKNVTDIFKFTSSHTFKKYFPDGIDVAVSDFVLRPVYTNRVKATEGPMTDFHSTFTYTRRGNPPGDIKYKFYMSPDGDSYNPDNKELLPIEGTVSSPTQSAEVTGMVVYLIIVCI